MEVHWIKLKINSYFGEGKLRGSVSITYFPHGIINPSNYLLCKRNVKKNQQQQQQINMFSR